MPECQVRLLSKEDVDALLTEEDVISTVEAVFRGCAAGRVTQTHPEMLFADEGRENMFMPMPALLQERGVAGLKWVNMFGRQQPGYPAMFGHLIVLNSPENGGPYAIVEGTAITNRRTAGGHAVAAAKVLARPDARVMAVVGCGSQGRQGLNAFLPRYPLEEVRLYDRWPAAAAALAAGASARCPGVRFTVCEAPRAAVAGADIVLTATTSKETLVEGGWLAPGSFTAALFHFNDLDWRYARACDKWVLGLREADYGSILHNKDVLAKGADLKPGEEYGDLSDVLTGRLPGRTRADERILYTHMGMGALDVALADVVFRRAVETDRGQLFRFA